MALTTCFAFVAGTALATVAWFATDDSAGESFGDTSDSSVELPAKATEVF